MKSNHYRAVVIGGGVVGVSVLYHLAKLGWTDVLLVERSELTAGSTWHAAGGFHALNGDPNVAALQAYTIGLYQELEGESGQSCGLHMTGGINLAGTPERWEWLKSQWAVFQTVGIETVRLLSPDEIHAMNPLVDVTGIYGGLYDDNEGHLDCSGVTYAYAASARNRGAEISLHNRVVELRPRPSGTWEVVTEHGTITADHVVNAGGLWARKVGRMAGVDLPVTPMEHHYLVTEAIPEVAALAKTMPLTVDLEGFTYARQEGEGLLLGVYELDPRHWMVEGAPWDFGVELLPEDVERISPELAIGLQRYPCMEGVGIRKWVNGAFTFTPDGNPLVGPVRGAPGFWVACGVMAGFSQGGGVGLSLAEWMVDGEPSGDVFGMDVARFGDFASSTGYLEATTAQFYKRRFVMTYPNEQLPAGRPLKMSALHGALDEAGAQWGASWGLEVPLYFVPDDPGFVEEPTLRRSNAFDIVGVEARATREGVGILDTTAFSRYEVRGTGARAWLEQLMASAIPTPGAVRLAPMVSHSGRLLGDLTVTCWAEDDFWIMGSYYLRAWHMRWFESQLPTSGGVAVRDISDAVAGLSLSGPASRDLLDHTTKDDVSNGALGRMRASTLDVGLHRVRIARLSITGELGYELNVPATELPGLHRTIGEAAARLREQGVNCANIGFNAANALRVEKSYGIWSREFAWSYTPGMSGLDRFVDFTKPSFIGRDALLRERDSGTKKRLVTLAVETSDADASPFEPVWDGERRVGFVTSGAFGHTTGKSLALGYVDRTHTELCSSLEVHVVGERRPATVIADSPYDPEGLAQRA